MYNKRESELSFNHLNLVVNMKRRNGINNDLKFKQFFKNRGRSGSGIGFGFDQHSPASLVGKRV